MRYAIISDIHSNYEALKSALRDIKKQDVDQIICLGDIIGKGENAHKCVQLVKKYCDIVVAGNTDIRFSSNAEDFKDNELEYKRILWNQSLLTQEDIEYLQNLPLCHEIKAGKKLIRMFHATPDSIFRFVNDYDTDMSLKYGMFLPSTTTISQNVADIVIYGHLHYQYLSTIYNKTLMCCGSAGNSICLVQNDDKNSNPDSVCRAHYMLLDIDLQNNVSYCFKSCKYNINAELKSNKTNFELDTYQVELTEGRYRNMERVNKSFEAQGYDISKF